MTDLDKQTKTQTPAPIDKKATVKQVWQERNRLRRIPIWLRVVLVLCLFSSAALLGVAFGFSVLGDGEFRDAFSVETWRHIFDIYQGVE